MAESWCDSTIGHAVHPIHLLVVVSGARGSLPRRSGKTLKRSLCISTCFLAPVLALVCLPVCLSACLPVCLPICVYICLCVCLSARVCLCLYLCLWLSVDQLLFFFHVLDKCQCAFLFSTSQWAGKIGKSCRPAKQQINNCACAFFFWTLLPCEHVRCTPD